MRDSFAPLELVEKYDRPGPRYTSYPTAPQFTDAFGSDDFASALGRMSSSRGLSLYVHLPYCRSLCTYCGCHMRVTHKRESIAGYLDYLMREIEQTAAQLPDREVVQMHWGGGTPTYLLPEEIEALGEHMQQQFRFAEGAEISIEGDPRGLTREHVVSARKVGFNRISFGVQDLDPEVQKAIGRIQPREMVEESTAWARELGFESVSYDLIYGLPHQSVDRFDRTIDDVLEMDPDRISLFSYAHVPWMKSHQRLIEEGWLPAPEEKLRIMIHTGSRLTENGYRAVGMDHFAKPGDSLVEALDEGTLQRNFQGYTTHAGADLLAFGVSGISQVADTYAQNLKNLRHYYDAIDAGRAPTLRGYRLSEDDKLRREVIMTIMCQFHLDIPSIERRYEIEFADYFADALEALRPLEEDGLLRIGADRLDVTESGQLLVRNIAMPFDRYLKNSTTTPTYSKTI